MGFHELEYVVEIAKEHNISKAAVNLYISQPALSRFLKRLESSLGVELFQQVGKKLILTYAGEQYVKMAKGALELKYQFEDKIKDMSEMKAGKISIGMTQGRGKTVLPIILPEYVKRFPNIEIEIYQEQASILEDKLKNGIIQIALFTIEDDDYNDYNQFSLDTISKEEVILFVPRSKAVEAVRKHGFKYPWVDIKQFEQELFLVLDENSRLRQTTNKLFREHDMRPRQMEFTYVDTMIELVSKDFGVAIISGFNVDAQEKVGALYSIGQRPPVWRFVAAHRIGSYVSDPVQELVKITKEYFGGK